MALFYIACEFHGDMDGDKICPPYKFIVKEDNGAETISVYRPQCLVGIFSPYIITINKKIYSFAQHSTIITNIYNCKCYVWIKIISTKARASCIEDYLYALSMFFISIMNII